MQNISTIYRFNTPFLDIASERKGLLLVCQNIKKVLKFDNLYFQEASRVMGDYTIVSLILGDGLGKINFFYITDITKITGNSKEYYLPIFKMDIWLNINFLSSNEGRKRGVNFMTALFESFDGLNEREFLIDVNSDFYFTQGFFRSKRYPHYDFQNISAIQKQFEKKGGMSLLEGFILQFSDSHFVLTKENSEYYHKIHGIMLYFIFLVYIIYQNLDRTQKAKETLENYSSDIEENTRSVELMNQRLQFVDDINIVNFKKYREKLNLFFNLF